MRVADHGFGRTAIQGDEIMRRVNAWLLAMVLVLAACGGETGAGDDGGLGQTGLPSESGNDDASAGGSNGGADSDGGSTTGGGISQAAATLVVGSNTYTWEGNQWTYCEISGLFPASVEFQKEEIKYDGDWFQFLDRGDGGINFSAVLEGEEYSGTGSGEADEIFSNGFTYTGFLSSQGERYDVQLEVSCG
jgi:hypothetical protein